MVFICTAVLPLTSDACSVYMSVFFFLVIGAASRPLSRRNSVLQGIGGSWYTGAAQ